MFVIEKGYFAISEKLQLGLTMADKIAVIFYKSKNRNGKM